MDYQRELQELIPTIKRAGERNITQKLGSIEVLENQSTSAHDLVTTSDLNISEELLNAVREKYPLSFTEESLKLNPENARLARAKKGHRWVIDPVDGTLDLKARDAIIKGELKPAPNCEVRGSSGIIAGLLNEENTPVAMIGYVPETDILVYSTLHEGPFVEVQGKLVPPAEPTDKIVGVQRTVVRLKKVQDFYEFLAEELGKDLEIKEAGGPGAVAPRLVIEPINVYLATIAGNWKEWDTVGVHVLASRMQGAITDLSGGRLQYNQPDPLRHHGMFYSNTSHLGISHRGILEKVVEFEERFGNPLLEPERRDGVSIYNFYKECIANPKFLV